MDINFELYKIFCVVADNKSISKGAEKLLISQPAVSQAIHNLEGQLNATLFVRTKKGIILTNEGQELYNYVKEGMNYFVNGTNKILELKNLETGIIKIGASTSITENILMKYISDFHKLYPNIEIKIINDLTDNLVKELRNGNLDIVIGNETYKENKDLIFKPFKEIEYIFVCNKKLELDIKDVLNKGLIIQTSPSISRSVFDKFIKDNNYNYNLKIEVVSHRLITEFVKNGFGIGVVIKDYILNDLNSNLFEVKTNMPLPKRNVGYVLKLGTISSNAVNAFIKLIEE